MGQAAKKIIYPYIISDSSIADGAPIIEGSRTTVRSIVGYYQLGMSVDEILEQLSHLSISKVYSALGYYFDHQEEIDADLATSSDLDHWKKQAQSNGSAG